MLWLVAYFWHFLRASLVILLDPDLRDALMASRVCRAFDDDDDDDVGDNGAAIGFFAYPNAVNREVFTVAHFEDAKIRKECVSSASIVRGGACDEEDERYAAEYERALLIDGVSSSSSETNVV